MRRSECEEIIRNSWQAGEGHDNFDKLFRGVEACQFGLRQMSRAIVDSPRKQIASIREQIHFLSQEEVTEEKRAVIA